MDNFKDNILRKIKIGEIDMKPRWHFVLRTVLLMVSLCIVAVIAIYLLSFVFFALHKTGLWFAPLYGFRGIMIFIVSSPWLLITLVILFLFLLYVLVKQYSFSYKKPLLYSMVGVVIFVIAISSLIQQIAIHEHMHSFLERHEIPGLTPFYRNAGGGRPDGMVAGTIIEIRGDGFIFESDTDEKLFVARTKYTKQPQDVVYKAGDQVIIFGDRDGSTINAFGIRPTHGAHFPPRDVQHTLSQ